MKCYSCLLLTGILSCYSIPAVLGQIHPVSDFSISSNPKRSSLNLADNILSPGNRPKLEELILHAGVLPTLSGSTLYTFFAPNEEALKEIQYESSERLRVILLNHIIPGTYKLDDLADGTKLQTLSGETITIVRKKDQTLINGIPVLTGNHMAKNGIMHSIGDILKPKNLE